MCLRLLLPLTVFVCLCLLWPPQENTFWENIQMMFCFSSTKYRMLFFSARFCVFEKPKGFKNRNNMIKFRFFYNPYRTPFDQRSIIGYSVITIIELPTAQAVTAIFCSACFYFLDICWYIETALHIVSDMYSRLDTIIGKTNDMQTTFFGAILYQNSIIRYTWRKMRNLH